MKQLLYSLCIGSMAVAFTAWGAPNDQPKRKGHAPTQARSGMASSTVKGARAQRNVTSIRSNHRNHVPSSTRSSAAVNRPRAIHKQRVATGNSIRSRRNVAVTGKRNFTAKSETRRAVGVNRQRDLRTTRARNIETNRSRNVTVTNNWRGNRFSGQQYAAFRNYHRQWHSRDWWRHNHSRIVFVFGAPYYWGAGYWYPAWGYYPTAYYPYDGPIYAGNADLTPDQVTVSVQEQLRRDGYYAGPIDGVLGPMTRRAIAAFQADHGLAITSTIDEPTLNTLGLS